jgi:hypothetical protein
MAKVVTPITAKVEVIGKPKASSSEPNSFYFPCLFIDLAQPEGSESAKIWKSLSADEVSQICKGDVVQLVPAGQNKNGKVKHNIVIGLNSTESTEFSTAESPDIRTTDQTDRGTSLPSRNKSKSVDIDAETKRQIATFIVAQSDLYRFCYQTAQTKLDGVTDNLETTRCMTTTLYLGAVRKFGLDR